MKRKHSWFSRFAKRTEKTVGHPLTFALMVLLIIVWGITGPIFGFSDTWQLVINTGTTIVTFLMVFLIQNTQNRDSEAVQIKLDELIRSIAGARNTVIDLEELDETQLESIRQRYLALAERARRKGDTSCEEQLEEAAKEVALEEEEIEEEKQEGRKVRTPK